MGFNGTIPGLTATGQQINAAARPRFVENLQLRTSFANAQCLHAGKLWGYNQNASGAYTVAVTNFDGTSIALGGKPVGANAYQFVYPMFSDGTSLYMVVTGATKVSVPFVDPDGKTGTFTTGETMTQDQGGGAIATGYFIRFDGATMIMQLKALAGGATGFVNTTPITGATGSITPNGAGTSTAAYLFLQKSATGAEDFVPVLDIALASQANVGSRSFCDCGLINGEQVLLFAPYMNAAGNYVTPVFYNKPGTDSSWTKLFDFVSGSIGHVHMIKVFRDVGGVTGQHKLICTTGDAVNTAGILVCDDIADFIANGSTWGTRWGADKTGATRNTWLTVGQGKPYCWGMKSQDATYKQVDLLYSKDKNYVYGLPDGPDPGYDVKLKRFRLSDGTYTTGATIAKGPGAYGEVMSDGTIVMGCFSEKGAGGYVGGSDADMHFYIVDEANCDIVEFYKTYRGETGIAAVSLAPILEFPAAANGIINIWGACLNPQGAQRIPMVGKLIPPGVSEGDTAEMRAFSNTPLINLVKDPRFIAGVSQFGSGYNGAITQNTTRANCDTANYEATSLSFVPDATTNAAWAPYTLSNASVRPDILNGIKGKYVTVTGRILANVTAQTVSLQVIQSVTGPAWYTTTMSITPSSAWQDFNAIVFVAPTCTDLEIRMQTRAAGQSNRGACFLSDLTVVPGVKIWTLPRRVPASE